MDETVLMQGIVQQMLDAAQNAKSKHIRVVNLAVCDKQVDPNELTRAFETLTFTTIAQGARLHLRRDDPIAIDPMLEHLAVDKQTYTVRLDSLELD
ncbi:MAG: hydrogenase maturation nickel metallochaperone HypA [Chloroflexi bacterium]|nr:hydrogenase maturation nickel metallochaperone HypA [Chloroflexota bacterium]